LPLELLGFGESEPYVLEEQFSGRSFERTGRGFWVRLVPEVNPAEIFRVRKAGT
jgi:starch synthase (maltosyl-transferring)